MTRRAFDHLKGSCDAEALLRRAGLTLQGIEDPQAREFSEARLGSPGRPGRGRARPNTLLAPVCGCDVTFFLTILG